MNVILRAALAALVAGAGLAAGPSSAQTVFRCQDGAGKTIMSDRPCDTSTKPAGTVATAPAMGPRWNAPIRPAGAPEHYDYMSGSCRSLHDAIRGARGSGIMQTIRRLQEEWNQRCREDEQDAYRQLYEKQKADRSERVAVKKAEAAQVQQERTAKQLCADMAQILAAKRARTDLNESERAELQRFADNHRARCLQ